jgi:hypothetical protein
VCREPPTARAVCLLQNREPLDFTGRMRLLCQDMAARLPDALGHVDMSRVAVSLRQTRNSSQYGVYATLTPLRFLGGQSFTVRHGRRWNMPRLYDRDGREQLYLLNFYLPRFLDLDLPHKLRTTVHELWHVSPQFDGDLRRFPGRCQAHGSSRKRFDAHADELVARWLATDPPEHLYAFLQHDFSTLLARHGRVVGTKIRTPRLVRGE